MIEETTAWVLVLVLAGVLMLLVLAVACSKGQHDPDSHGDWPHQDES
jgi:hypothetical protein